MNSHSKNLQSQTNFELIEWMERMCPTRLLNQGLQVCSQRMLKRKRSMQSSLVDNLLYASVYIKDNFTIHIKVTTIRKYLWIILYWFNKRDKESYILINAWIWTRLIIWKKIWQHFLWRFIFVLFWFVQGISKISKMLVMIKMVRYNN